MRTLFGIRTMRIIISIAKQRDDKIELGIGKYNENRFTNRSTVWININSIQLQRDFDIHNGNQTFNEGVSMSNAPCHI